MKPTLSIIIVSYNTKRLTLQCIKSIFSSKPKVNFEVIVVDNASQDGSAEALSKIKNIKLIRNFTNTGFARANNKGIKKAKGQYILLLNSDTETAKGSLDKLVDFARKNPDAGVVSPRLLNSDKTIQASVYNFPTIRNAILEYWFGKKGAYEKHFPKSSKPVKVEALVAAAFLITPKARKKVGLLDTRYFMFFEDLDYCRRVRKSGLKIYYLPTVNIIHHHGASGKKIAKSDDQWRRLVSSSKIYHGAIKHYILWFILYSAQKFTQLKVAVRL